MLRIRRRTIDDNLAHAFPQQTQAQRRRLALDMWAYLVLMLCELIQLSRKLHDTNWRQHVSISPEAVELLIRQLISARATVFVSGHLGNFEVGGITAGLLGFPTFTVARPLDNRFLHAYVTQLREATGQFMLPKQGSAKQLDAILQSGGTMMLLGDQSAGPKGCWVEFFGRPASCHKAVALFSLVNRSPMMLGFSVRLRPMKFRIGVADLFDPMTDDLGGVKPVTQWYNEQLERVVRAYPEQYWWLHDRWKNRPQWQAKRRQLKRRFDRAAAPPGGSQRPAASTNPAHPHPSRDT